MILFPAIDLKDGQCVRLIKGDMAQAIEKEDDAEYEQQMVVAGDHVLRAEIPEWDQVHAGDLHDVGAARGSGGRHRA